MTGSPSGGVNEGFKNLGHGQVVRQPGADDLRCQPGVAGRQRLTRQGCEIAVHLRHQDRSRKDTDSAAQSLAAKYFTAFFYARRNFRYKTAHFRI